MVRLLVGALVIVLGLGAAPAAGADPWSPATVVSLQAHVPLAVTVDDLGRATAVVRSEREPYDLFVVRRSTAGTWGTPVKLGQWAYHSQVTARTDRTNRVTVVWTNRNATTQRIAAAVYVPRVGWSTTLISPAGVAGSSPVAAMNADGRTLVAWTAFSPDGTKRYVQSAVDAGGGDWRPARTHAEGADVSAQDVAVDDDGAMALAAWTGADASFQRRSVGGTWSSWYRQADSAQQARLALVDGALTWVFWRVTGEDYYGDPVHAPYARLRRADGSWTSAVRLAGDGTYKLTLAVDPQGRATVAYFSGDDTYGAVLARHRRSDGTWPRAVQASPDQAEHDWPIDLTVDSRGVLHFSVRLIGKDGWHYIRKVPGQAWLEPEQVVGSYTDRRALGVAPGGHVAAVWNGQPDGVHGRVRTP